MEEKRKASKTKMVFVPVIILIVFWAVLFVPAGSLNFRKAWIYWTGFSVMTLFTTVYFMKKSPDLLARRTKFKEKEDTRKPPAILNLFMLSYIIPGLDFRFHWSLVPDWISIAADAIALAGYIFIIFVFRENSYASTTIQVEKEQRVISTGPYAIVRHPMYLGLVVLIMFTPIALGSYWALLPAILCIPLNVYRIKGEEEVLLKNLKGYDEYCKKTRYRLLPFIW